MDVLASSSRSVFSGVALLGAWSGLLAVLTHTSLKTAGGTLLLLSVPLRVSLLRLGSEEFFLCGSLRARPFSAVSAAASPSPARLVCARPRSKRSGSRHPACAFCSLCGLCFLVCACFAGDLRLPTPVKRLPSQSETVAHLLIPLTSLSAFGPCWVACRVCVLAWRRPPPAAAPSVLRPDGASPPALSLFLV